MAEGDRRPILSLALTVNHPQRLLAECEAKRRIVERSVAVLDGVQPYTYQEWQDGRADLARQDLQTLAVVYGDHPDFREEWRP